MSIDTNCAPAGLRWLLKIGIVQGVLVVTGLSIVLSLMLTGLYLRFVVVPPVPFERWVPIAIVVPSVVAPLVSSAVLTLAYRLLMAKAALDLAVRTDCLTGIGNRRAFIEQADREMARFRRHGRAFSIIIFDLDHFKALNDRHGHSAGDQALVDVANLCKSLLRRSDLLCRWGGEEFIALLPETSLADAVQVAETLRIAVAHPPSDGARQLSASFGVATSAHDSATLDAIIQTADRQLYLAKRQGRDRVMPTPSDACGSPRIRREDEKTRGANPDFIR